MCIKRSVGVAGRNDLADVAVVQLLLNANLGRFAVGAAPQLLKVDGRIGPKTLDALARFEVEVLGWPDSDRMLVPGDATLRGLLAGLAPGPTREKLAIVMPQALPRSIERYHEPLVAGMTARGIDRPLRIAHFIAQLAHESGSFRYTEELADGTAYEGRRDLGNTEPGDGPRFKGRGLIQLTGRANYAAYSKDTGIDYLTRPQRIATDRFAAVDVACWFWHRHRLNALADRDDIAAVTRRINGGYNGLDDRVDYLARGKAVLGLA